MARGGLIYLGPGATHERIMGIEPGPGGFRAPEHLSTSNRIKGGGGAVQRARQAGRRTRRRGVHSFRAKLETLIPLAHYSSADGGAISLTNLSTNVPNPSARSRSFSQTSGACSWGGPIVTSAVRRPG